MPSSSTFILNSKELFWTCLDNRIQLPFLSSPNQPGALVAATKSWRLGGLLGMGCFSFRYFIGFCHLDTALATCIGNLFSSWYVFVLKGNLVAWGIRPRRQNESTSHNSLFLLLFLGATYCLCAVALLFRLWYPCSPSRDQELLRTSIARVFQNSTASSHSLNGQKPLFQRELPWVLPRLSVQGLGIQTFWVIR